jgi:hypothetical protein
MDSWWGSCGARGMMDEDELSSTCGALSCRERRGRWMVRGLVFLGVGYQEVTGGSGQQMPDVRGDVSTGRAEEAVVFERCRTLPCEPVKLDTALAGERPMQHTGAVLQKVA